MSLSPRDTFVRYIDPLEIYWEDALGQIHFSVVNALKVFDLPDTPEHREAVIEIAMEGARKAGMPTPIYRDKPDSIDYFTQTQKPDAN